jgi:hypothetical protein
MRSIVSWFRDPIHAKTDGSNSLLPRARSRVCDLMPSERPATNAVLGFREIGQIAG